MSTPQTDYSRRALTLLWPHLQAHRARIALCLLLLIAGRLADVCVPFALKEIIDALSGVRAAPSLPAWLLVAYGLLRLSGSALGELKDIVFARVVYGPIRVACARVLAHVLDALSLRFHLEHRPGDVSRDILRGAQGMRLFLDFAVFNILPTLVQIALAAALLFTSYPVQYGLITLVAAAAYLLGTVTLTEWRMRFYRTLTEAESDASGRALESLLHYDTVKYFGSAQRELARYRFSLERWEQAALSNQASLSALHLVQGAVLAGGVTLLLALAATEVLSGTMTLGDLVLISALLVQVTTPMQFLGVVHREMRHALADMGRMFALLDHVPEIADAGNAQPLRMSAGAVRFESVDFDYERGRPGLRGVDFELPGGGMLAVVGPSGAGKSTLGLLLLRCYEPQGGRLLVDGQDVRDVTQASLRSQIAFVPQHVRLFNDTIFANIAYARPEATAAQIETAARSAGLEPWLRTLPEGYDTLVGDGGLKLSGGERQRVALARALLKDAGVLVLDEPTSALDADSERRILDGLRRRRAGQSLLLITHRLAAAAEADHILVLQGGRIVEHGTHACLLAAGGPYAQTWSLQQDRVRPAPVASLQPARYQV